MSDVMGAMTAWGGVAAFVVLSGGLFLIWRDLGKRTDQLGTSLDGKIKNSDERLGGRIDRLGGRIDRVESRLGERIARVITRLDAKLDKMRKENKTAHDQIGDNITALKTDLNARMGRMEKRLTLGWSEQAAHLREDNAETRKRIDHLFDQRASTR